MDADHIVVKDPSQLAYGWALYSRNGGANNAFHLPAKHEFTSDLMTVGYPCLHVSLCLCLTTLP